jgi:hypothetical protein
MASPNAAVRGLWAAGRAGGLVLAAILLMGIGPREQAAKPGGASAEALASYRRDMLSYFRSHYLLPIIVPEGQSVGDVYSADFWSLEERAKSCFPTLSATPPAPAPIDLPMLAPSAASSAALAAGLSDLARQGVAPRTALLFADATVTTASKGELRRALSKDCAYLTPILEEQTVGKGGPVKIILGRVVHARKSVFFGFDALPEADGSVRALTERLTAGAANRFKARLLDGRASAAFDARAKSGVLLESREPVPIAFAPAFLPKLVVDGFGFNEPGAVGSQQFKWDPFDPAAKAEDRQLFDGLVEALSR